IAPRSRARATQYQYPQDSIRPYGSITRFRSSSFPIPYQRQRIAVRRSTPSLIVLKICSNPGFTGCARAVSSAGDATPGRSNESLRSADAAEGAQDVPPRATTRAAARLSKEKSPGLSEVAVSMYSEGTLRVPET